jgi:hypothetical protein
MSLLIPQEYRKDVSQRSGFLKHGTLYAEKNLKGLFLAPANIKYLGAQLYTLCTFPARIMDVINIGLSKSDYTDARSQYGARASQQQSGGKSGTFVGGKFAPATNYPQEVIRLSAQLKKYKTQIEDIIPEFVETYHSKFWSNDFFSEDYSTNSPIQQLHHLNQKFLLETSQNIIQSPDIVIANHFDINPDTGVEEYGESDFSARSYSDGTWHPEDLFVNTARNRENPYWIPREITFDSNPPRSRMKPVKEQGFSPFSENRVTRKEDLKGMTYHHREGYQNGPARRDDDELEDLPDVGDATTGDILLDGNMDRGDYGIPAQKYSYDPLLDNPMYGPGPGPGNRYAYNFYGQGGFSKGGTFPAWQYTPNFRAYDQHNDDGLREGGMSDRRVDSARRTGYDMSALISKSSY